jgi:hypothetical protein
MTLIGVVIIPSLLEISWFISMVHLTEMSIVIIIIIIIIIIIM